MSAGSTTSRLRALRSSLGRYLAPSPAAEPAGDLGRLELGVLVGAALVLATVLGLLRLGWSDSLNTIWAEDGPIYLQAALTQGFWHAVFSPYAGYLVFVPRLIAEIATLVPLQYASAAIAIVSSLIAALSGFAIWVASGGHIRSPYLRLALALATAFAATAGQETVASAAYAPWFMLVAAFWLLFWRPRTVASATAGGLFLLATGLSTPGVWFFLPVALLRAATIRDARDGVLMGGYAVGAIVQVPVVLGQQQGEPIWTSHIWTAYVQRVLDGGVFGERLGGNLWSDLGWPFLVLLIAALLVGFAVGLRRAGPSSRWFVGLALPTSAVMFVLSAYQRSVGFNIFWSPESSGGTASRYVLVPALLLLSAIAVTVDGAVRRHRREPGLAWPVVATLALVGVAVASSFNVSNPAARGQPYWEDALRAAADKCLSHGEETAGIATSPSPFGVQIPCEEIASFADERIRARGGQASVGP